MAENQKTYYNSGRGGNDVHNPRSNLPRTRSVVGPRPLPGSSSKESRESVESRDASYQHQKQYSIPEYYPASVQNSNPQNFIPPQQPMLDTSDQPFPPLVSPKPQKPMPTVTKDIT